MRILHSIILYSVLLTTISACTKQSDYKKYL